MGYVEKTKKKLVKQKKKLGNEEIVILLSKVYLKLASHG